MNFSNDAPSIRCVRLLKHHVDQSYRKKNQTTGSIRLDFQKTTGAAAAAVSFLLPLAVRLLTTSSGETYTIFFKKKISTKATGSKASRKQLATTAWQSPTHFGGD
jgi:hypothetical protein